eukprot:1530018-Pyramimonas_sp.AAC.1
MLPTRARTSASLSVRIRMWTVGASVFVTSRTGCWGLGRCGCWRTTCGQSGRQPGATCWSRPGGGPVSTARHTGATVGHFVRLTAVRSREVRSTSRGWAGAPRGSPWHGGCGTRVTPSE